jgi:hypothetical protein
MDKAMIKMITGKDNDPIEVMFNPTDYSITRNMSYAEVAVPGLAMPLLQFIRGESQQLTLELFLDSSDRKGTGPSIPSIPPALPLGSPHASPELVPADKWKQLARSPHAEHRLMALRRLAQIDAELHAPPVIEFAWTQVRFRGVITGFTEKFTMFDAEGNIVRARVQLQIKSWSNPDSLFQEPPRQSPDRTKTRVVRAGERLDLIAAEEYGDSARWTVIAKANDITRPRILTPGTLLVVPPID